MPGDLAGEDRAARRARFDEPHRKADRGLDRGQPAARQHQEERAHEALAMQQGFEIGEISADQRLDISIGTGGREALVFAHLRRHLARQGDHDFGQAHGEDLTGAALVRRVRKAVEEANCDRLNTLGGEAIGELHERPLVKRDEDPAAGIDALAHRIAQPAGDERRGQVDIDVVLLEPVLVPDLDRVAEALGGNEGGLGALTLDDCIGRQRRAMDDDRQISRRQRGFLQDRADGFENGTLRGLWSGQDLDAVAAPVRFERDVCERAADIDA